MSTIRAKSILEEEETRASKLKNLLFQPVSNLLDQNNNAHKQGVLKQWIRFQKQQENKKGPKAISFSTFCSDQFDIIVQNFLAHEFSQPAEWEDGSNLEGADFKAGSVTTIKNIVDTQFPVAIQTNYFRLSKEKYAEHLKIRNQTNNLKTAAILFDFEEKITFEKVEPKTSCSSSPPPAPKPQIDIQTYVDKIEIPVFNSMTLEEQQHHLTQLRKYVLTPEEIAIIKNHLAKRPSDEKIMEKFNIDMTVKKMLCLNTEKYLNDEVINFYMMMLQERDYKLQEQLQRVRCSHYFNSFFIDRLLDHGLYTYSNVQRWSKKLNVFNLEKIYMPINILNLHWTMMIIFVQQKQIKYYNSMDASGTDFMKAALRWLGDEVESKPKKYKMCGFNQAEWNLLNVSPDEVPKQGNGFDCGMFSIYCADYVSDDLPLTYNQAQMDNNRYRVFDAILKGQLRY